MLEKEGALTTQHGDHSSPEAPWDDYQRRHPEHKNGQSPGPSTERQLNTLDKSRPTRASHQGSLTPEQESDIIPNPESEIDTREAGLP